MEEIGRVINVQNKDIVIELGGSSACGSCNSCGNSSRAGLKSLTLENTINAKVNDMVILDVSQAKSVLASLILFVFPLLMMILGYFLGEQIATFEFTSRGENPAAIISSIFFLFLSIGMIYFFDRFIAKRNKLKPKLVGLYEPADERNTMVIPLDQ